MKTSEHESNFLSPSFLIFSQFPLLVTNSQYWCLETNVLGLKRVPTPYTPSPTSVPDPGSGAFLTTGSGMSKKSGSGLGSGMNNPNHISESLNSLWIRDPGWKKFGSGMEKIRIRDQHTGSTTLCSIVVVAGLTVLLLQGCCVTCCGRTPTRTCRAGARTTAG